MCSATRTIRLPPPRLASQAGRHRRPRRQPGRLRLLRAGYSGRDAALRGIEDGKDRRVELARRVAEAAAAEIDRR